MSFSISGDVNPIEDVELRNAYFSYPTKTEQLLTCNEVA